MSKASNRSLFFYQGNVIITVTEGSRQRTIFRNAHLPLAELKTDDTYTSSLLAIDDKDSVFVAQTAGQQP